MCACVHSLTGYSPFQGETHQETFLNVSQCDYDFDDEVFDVVSQEAKDFIELLLVHVPRYVRVYIRTSVRNIEEGIWSSESTILKSRDLV